MKTYQVIVKEPTTLWIATDGEVKLPNTSQMSRLKEILYENPSVEGVDVVITTKRDVSPKAKNDVALTPEGKLLALKMHETLQIDDNVEVMRVPGGWMYTHQTRVSCHHTGRQVVQSSVFVPFHKL